MLLGTIRAQSVRPQAPAATRRPRITPGACSGGALRRSPRCRAAQPGPGGDAGDQPSPSSTSPQRDPNGRPAPPAADASDSGEQQQQQRAAAASTEPDERQRRLGERRKGKTAEEIEAEEAADRMLEPAWLKLKESLKKELPPDQAKEVDKLSLSEVVEGDSLMRSVAESQLGPLLASMGSSEDPYAFFIDLVKIACSLQLASAAVLFYACELGLHLDVGDSFRAVAGLGVGYFARIFIPIEQLVWPLYNGLLQLVAPNAVYETGYVSPEERAKTLNSLGVAVAAGFLLPRYLLGWATDDTLQIVLPMLGGIFLFDLAYLAALLYKLSALDSDGEGGGKE